MRATAFVLTLGVLALGCEDPGSKVAGATLEPATSDQAGAKSSPGQSAASLAVNPSNSKVEFVGAKVTASHPGGFTDFSGKVELGDPIEKSQIEVTIQTASLYADKSKLSKHLKSADFFDVAQFPTATFRSTEIKKDGEGHTITGDLTLHGVTKRISFPATVAVTGATLSANAEFSINRQDFGINYPGMRDDLIRDLVVIKLSLNLPRES